MKVAILYGSTTGKTEAVADLLQRLFQRQSLDVDVLGVADTEPSDLDSYDAILFGSSTWGTGALQDDWQSRIDEFPAQLAGSKAVAFFGLGDRVAFPETFCSAVALLQAKFGPAARKVFDPPLLLDDDNEGHLTERLVTAWSARLQAEGFGVR